MITIFIGIIGQGKSLSATLYAELIRNNFIKNKKLNQIEFYDNLKYIHNTDTLSYYFNHNKEIDNNNKQKILIIDELQAYIDSRNSMSTQNKKLSHAIKLSRHYHIDIIGTTTRYNSIDINIRKITRYIISPDILKMNGKLNITWNIYDIIKDKNKTKSFLINPKIYKFYDTHSSQEIINKNLDIDLKGI